MSQNTNSSTTSSLTRFQEVAAMSAASEIVKRLHTQVCEPTGKQYARQRAERLASWAELRIIAETQSVALAADAPTRVERRAKVRAAGVPITTAEIEQKVS